MQHFSSRQGSFIVCSIMTMYVLLILIRIRNIKLRYILSLGVFATVFHPLSGTTNENHSDFTINGFEPVGTMFSCYLIVREGVVLRRIVVGCGDWPSTNWVDGHHQSQMKSCCQWLF